MGIRPYEPILWIMENFERAESKDKFNLSLARVRSIDVAFLIDTYRNDEPDWPPAVVEAVRMFTLAVDGKGLFDWERTELLKSAIESMRDIVGVDEKIERACGRCGRTWKTHSTGPDGWVCPGCAAEKCGCRNCEKEKP